MQSPAALRLHTAAALLKDEQITRTILNLLKKDGVLSAAAETLKVVFHTVCNGSTPVQAALCEVLVVALIATVVVTHYTETLTQCLCDNKGRKIMVGDDMPSAIKSVLGLHVDMTRTVDFLAFADALCVFALGEDVERQQRSSRKVNRETVLLSSSGVHADLSSMSQIYRYMNEFVRSMASQQDSQQKRAGIETSRGSDHSSSDVFSSKDCDTTGKKGVQGLKRASNPTAVGNSCLASREWVLSDLDEVEGVVYEPSEDQHGVSSYSAAHSEGPVDGPVTGSELETVSDFLQSGQSGESVQAQPLVERAAATFAELFGKSESEAGLIVKRLLEDASYKQKIADGIFNA